MSEEKSDRWKADAAFDIFIHQAGGEVRVMTHSLKASDPPHTFISLAACSADAAPAAISEIKAGLDKAVTDAIGKLLLRSVFKAQRETDPAQRRQIGQLWPAERLKNACLQAMLELPPEDINHARVADRINLRERPPSPFTQDSLRMMLTRRRIDWKKLKQDFLEHLESNVRANDELGVDGVRTRA
jgi:hypothetical protein